jgi:membrane-associated phospholipid phosphatase
MLANTPKQKISFLFLTFLIPTIISYFFLDQTLALDIKNNFSDKNLKLFCEITWPIEPLITPLYLLILFKIFESYSTQLKDLINVGAATVCSIVVVSFVKLFLSRPRPLFFLTHGVSHIMPLHLDPSMISMPSGHAAAAGTLAALLWIMLKGKFRFLISIPILLSLFRVLSLKHFLSDVILGFGIGYCIVLIFYISDKNFIDKIKDKLWKNGKIV